MSHMFSNPLDLRENLDSSRAASDQGNPLTRGIEFFHPVVPIGRMHNPALEVGQVRNLWPCPAVQHSDGADQEVGLVMESLQEVS